MPAPMIETVRRNVRNLPRPVKRALLIATDVALLFFVLWASYSLRLGRFFVPTPEQFAVMACAPVMAVPIFARLGLYRAVIRYLPERAIWVTVRAMSLATLVWITALFLTSMSGIEGAPRSIPLFYWVFGIWAVAGVRFGAKALLWPRAGRQTIRRQVLVYGTDDAALQLAAAINQQQDRLLAGFLETNASLFGRDIMGVRVYPESMVADLIRNFGIREILVSLPSVDPDRRKKLLSDLREHPVKIRALPAMSEMTSGRALEAQLRNMEIDDLLGRSAVPPRTDLLMSILRDKVVCVSGAGGSIGSELAKLVMNWSPRKLILLDINEYGLYQIERALGDTNGVEVVAALGSVVDEKLVSGLFRRHGVEIVFHTAAYKHVPLVEANPIEGARNNVLGTECIARTARDCGVERFVLISTDKAVRPSNVMGASKRWAELITRYYGDEAARRDSAQKFCIVRFGNVLGSSGSVVPLFREQIEAGGPITLTDEGMMRYFMSIHEAAELIVQAAALSEGGDIFLLDMGEQISVRKLAQNMIRLAGLAEKTEDQPDGDIEIRVTGMRPGEKLIEELFYDPSAVIATEHPKIRKARRSSSGRRMHPAAIDELRAAIAAGDPQRLRQKLLDFVSTDDPAFAEGEAPPALRAAGGANS